MANFVGETVNIGGTDYVVPPLSLRGLIQFEPQLKTFGQDGSLAVAVQLIGSALRRNYPELTDDALTDLLDVPTLQKLIAVVLRVSGVVDNGAPSGEGLPQSTGAI